MDRNFKVYNQTADILKAIAHPVRLCIIKGLLEKGSCNVSHMQECLELPQSTVSQHLQKLRSLGIVETERQGLEMIYSVKNEKIKQLIILFLGEEASHD
ncbi:ArsR/SmtB family transcription factor [Gorillibacterium sp. sgz5001074]|uniref:ArsR/SmtB family transcription factor n=1 Tax=Gorillibacterium sp. sgz5001074 TaxID=3446695 RepID=UPI003F671891